MLRLADEAFCGAALKGRGKTAVGRQGRAAELRTGSGTFGTPVPAGMLLRSWGDQVQAPLWVLGLLVIATYFCPAQVFKAALKLAGFWL